MCSRCPTPGTGDVEMCTHCGQWWYACLPIKPHEAAELARAPMDQDECLAALDRAAAAMEDK